MSIKDLLKKVCTKMGENNKATYAVVTIAVVKGIARPIFTMMDKHEDPETKKYTALREFLTEVVAIPTYLGCGELAGKVGGMIKGTPEQQAIAKNNFRFLGVCLAAVCIIPALASITIKPFMNSIQNKNKKDDDDDDFDDDFDHDEISRVAQVHAKPVFKGKDYMTNKYLMNCYQNSGRGMKVGGV